MLKKGVLPAGLTLCYLIQKSVISIQPYDDNNAWYMAKLVDRQERPDTMKGLQCMIAFNNPNNDKIKRTKEEAKVKADSLLTILKKKPEMSIILFQNVSDFGNNKEAAELNPLLMECRPQFIF